MHLKTKTFAFTLFSFFFLFAGKVLAANEGYVPLAPIPTIPTGTTPTLAVYMKGIFTAAVGLAIVFAVLMIVIGGIQYIVAQTPFAIGEGKSKITNAVVGLFILLISAVLLNTINPGLLRIGLNIDTTIFDAYTPGAGTESQSRDQYCIANPTTGEKTGGCYDSAAGCQSVLVISNPLGTTDDCFLYQQTSQVPAGTGNEDANRKLLTDTGHISVNADADRTQLSGVRPETLNEVKRVQTECNCDIVVTGGSENTGVHNCSNSSNPNHCNGHKVDLSSGGTQGTVLSNHIIDHPEQYTNIGTRSDGAIQYQSKTSGAIYALESDHWDVTVH